jgi:pimeloyl-ACP methyl ester carboxylesterase
MAEELFRPIFVPDKFREAVSGRAWLGAMLGAEGALAVAEARADLIPPDAAEVIVSCCKKVSDAGLFEPEDLGRKGRAQGNPVPPLVRVLTEAVSEVSEEAARYVHKGATSQDIVDTAAMLLTKRALDLILTEADAIADAVVERWFTPAFREGRPEVAERTRRMLLDTPAEGYAGCCEAVRDADLGDSLGTISAPTLVIAGADDPAAPPERAELIRASIPDAGLEVIPDAAHLANFEQPEAITQAILDHLSPVVREGR